MSKLKYWLNKHFHFFSLVNPTLISAALAIALLLFFTSLALRHVHASQERIARAHLQTSLNSISELITLWQQQNTAAMFILINSTQGKLLLKQVLLEQGDNPETHAALREWLDPVLLVMGFDGFSVINHQRMIVAATSKAYQQQPVSLLATTEVLDKVQPNRALISRPVIASLPLDGPRGRQPAGTLMQNMCVLFESEVTAAGHFCLRFNTQASFFPIFLKGRTGNSGEIYAIDAQGHFITPSRFGADAAAHNQSLGQVSTPVKVPSATDSGAVTEVVNSLIINKADFISANYSGYRGIAVAGAGRWLDEMELGVIVEQDVEEAMAPYLVSRNIIIALSISANLLIIILTITAIINRRRLLVREGRFRSLLDNLPSPVYMTTLDHHFIVVNPAFCQLLQLNKSQLLGKTIHELTMPPWIKSLFDAKQNSRIESLQQNSITTLSNADGNACYYQVVRFPVIYARGQTPQAYACIWLDVTARIVADQRLADVNQNLESLVNERTHELMCAKDDALAASQAKAEFLANMSHEIRTPLNAIIGLAHVALANKPDIKQRTYLEKMRGSGEHLLHVVNDILNFSRMEAGKLTLDHHAFSIVQLVDKSVDLIWEKAVAKGLQVKVLVDQKIPRQLLGDELRLGQILINFCANAVKFTDQGSISVRVNIVRDWHDRVELLFEVEDTGIGIDSEKQQKLFQPFQQVDSSSARRFEGAGLGLSICKNIADLMHAQIDVKSQPGAGSCFRLRVELQKSDLHAPLRVVPQAVNNTKLTRVDCAILVVEDNLLNQEIILSLLESMGSSAICVGSGQEALNLLQTQHVDIVLMDIQLPCMDGMETTARIRQMDVGKRLPIIAVTANALPGDKENYLAAGMDDYLSKPIEPAQLFRVLEQWGHGVRVEPPPVAAGDDWPGLQQAGIDTERALHNLMGNEKLYRRLLERFARERVEFPAQLIRLLATNQPEALNQVHSLKSLAGSLGMSQLAIHAFNLEQELHAGEWHQTSVEKLSGELIVMVALVSRHLSITLNK